MDVVIAYWLTSHVFWSYHQLFEMPRVMRAQAPLARLWWVKLQLFVVGLLSHVKVSNCFFCDCFICRWFWPAFWFETTVPEGPLDNKWDWPFPGPRLAIKAITTLNDSRDQCSANRLCSSSDLLLRIRHLGAANGRCSLTALSFSRCFLIRVSDVAIPILNVLIIPLSHNILLTSNE